MYCLLNHGILLAQGGRLDGLRKGFEGRRFDFGDVLTAVLILGGIGLAVWVLSYLLSLRERRRGYSSPLGLFLSLCKAHRLRWSQRWLLWRLARSQRLRDPALLFVEPERFQPASLGPTLRSRSDELAQLRGRLFAEPKQQSPRRPPAADSSLAGTPLPPVPSPPALDVSPWPPSSEPQR